MYIDYFLSYIFKEETLIWEENLQNRNIKQGPKIHKISPRESSRR